MRSKIVHWNVRAYGLPVFLKNGPLAYRLMSRITNINGAWNACDSPYTDWSLPDSGKITKYTDVPRPFCFSCEGLARETRHMHYN